MNYLSQPVRALEIKGRAVALPVLFSLKFFPVNPPAKLQISRSAPSLLTPSKIFTDIFRTANNLSVCKKTNHIRAGCASMSMAIHFHSCDSSRIFEQDFCVFLRYDHPAPVRWRSGGCVLVCSSPRTSLIHQPNCLS
uniref:Uncharacterized protein n=1 Tax=Klebsiella pneumoniae TaxID=573 RepID=A0A223DQD8_KLEPN|nr:Hypothetical protein [Klebsiella pneumoniae]